MSEPRKCQFFLRGRCQREKCEFSHVMPSNLSLPSSNGSKDQQIVPPSSATSAALCQFYQAGNCKFGDSCRFAHSEPSSFARGKGLFLSNKPKPVSKEVNLDSDDESIMRKGGDSDDDNESVGSGFTSIAVEKPENMMLPPSKTPLQPPATNPTIVEVVDISEEGDIVKESSICTASLPGTDTSLSTTVGENPTGQLLSRRGNLPGGSGDANVIEEIGGDGKALPSKERNKREIRRDSKTGFEKFEDYFDSDADNTTLISPDATSVDCKQSNNGTISDSKVLTGVNTKDTAEQINDKLEVVQTKEHGVEREPRETTLPRTELEKNKSDGKIQTSNKDSVATGDETISSKAVQGVMDANSSTAAGMNVRVPKATERMPEEIMDGGKDKPTEASASKLDNLKEQGLESESVKDNASKVLVREQPKNDIQVRLQAKTKKVKATPEDLSKDWDMDDESITGDETQKIPREKGINGQGNNDSELNKDTKEIAPAETIENIESFIQDEPKDTSTPAVQDPKFNNKRTIANVTTKPSHMGLLLENKAGEKRKLERTVGGKSKEEWVTVIFGEDGKQIDGSDRKGVMAAKSSTAKKSVYDLNPDGEDFSVDEKTPFTTKTAAKTEPIKETPRGRKDVLGKRSGVTKIGNNTYYYTGPKGDNAGDSQDDDGAEEEEIAVGRVNDGEDDDIEDERETGVITGGVEESWTVEEDEDGESNAITPKKRKVASKSYDSGRKKHNTTYVYGARSTAAKTRRCGECEGCNREDCGKCVTCLDKPKFGGRNSKKQACIYRMCAWKNPSGKRIKPGTAPVAAPPIAPDATTSPAAVRTLAVVAAARERETAAKGNSSRRRTAGKSASFVETPNSSTTSDLNIKKVEGKRGRKSISVISPASVPKRQSLDEELPQFDPNSFKPGYVPPLVKKGDEEYAIIVSGVKDTGLCGTYWSDMDHLPRRRRCTFNVPKPEVVQAPGTSTKTPTKSDTAASDSQQGGKERPPKTRESRKQALTPQKMMKEPEDKNPDEDEDQNNKIKGYRGKRKHPADNSQDGESFSADNEAPLAKRAAETGDGLSQKTVANGVISPSEKGTSINTDYEMAKQPVKALELGEEEASEMTRLASGTSNATGSMTESTYSDKNQESLSRTSTVNTPEQNAKGSGDSVQVSRSVSCVADTNTQREVVVECFAPYDDHRWVNIGKERDGMSPDAVQYARALRPPYHLLSFLRIKGHSTKGMSCTDKNTMVFVVLEGEITVVLHTTQFNARKGDSFYIPPKNYYNLINQNAREAELSLIQFQYDGPLPTVAAGSQSGLVKNPVTQGATTTSVPSDGETSSNTTK